jgi:(2R)-sulfolactate sulfo-lyase subunit alpha
MTTSSATEGDTVEHSFLVHDDADTVGVAVVDVREGQDVVASYMKSDKRVRVQSRADIPLGHKIALRDVDEGAEVLKYGLPIGRATSALRAGDYVHTHNLRSSRW